MGSILGFVILVGLFIFLVYEVVSIVKAIRAKKKDKNNIKED